MIVSHLEHRPCGEPRRYVWQTAGYLTVGTLKDYARQWEDYEYDDEQGALGAELRTWDETYTLTTRHLGTDEQDYIHVELRAGDEWVYVHIDGRS
ncbi:hypothetical protein [Nocardia abscessus]|uniref:hypothetical protein n=1 Tax=Nocardia abscessus TaxID=120957 RepID=UPI002454F04D|nr:hypothetical protein [Nocardia abscessus]